MFTTFEGLLPRIRDVNLSPEEIEVVTTGLEDLENYARQYGSETWVTPDATPAIVATMVYQAAARYARNIDGLIQSRAGDETVILPERENLGTASFTEAELDQLAAIAAGKFNAPNGFGSFGSWAFNGRPAAVEDRVEHFRWLHAVYGQEP